MTTPAKARIAQEMLRELGERSHALIEALKLENERMQVRIQALQADLSLAGNALAKEFEGSETEKTRLLQEKLKLIEENRDFARRYVELEEHASSLANLYAATFQLHATLDPQQVVRTIAEIAINLIGASEFIIYLADDTKGDFVVAAREGDLPPDVSRTRTLIEALERQAFEEGHTVFSEEPPGTQPVHGPICCTPLLHREKLVGLLTVYALLSHKKAFSALDSQLFDLLGEQAALAIVSSQAYIEVDRKLQTVKQFMRLLKS